MNKNHQIARQEQMRRLARINPYYAYELKKKHLDNQSEREVEVKRISREMRI